MKKKIVPFAFAALVVGCATVPITGRKQMNLLPESELMAMSLAQYKEFLDSIPPVPSSDPKAQMVKRVGERLASAATEFLNANGAGDRVAGFTWEFNLVNENTVNAWCMPGGKVVVYTGLLPVTQDETGLALVMGHEIAHAIARHGNERMSQSVAMQGVGSVAAIAASKPTLANELLLQAFGIGSQLGMLAYSRQHESEADKMGLVFMAMAGYDPRSAPEFWRRMAAQGGPKPPEILSTHPNDAKRVADLEAYMPEAMKYYKPR